MELVLLLLYSEWVETESTWYFGQNSLFYQPQMRDESDSGAIGGIKIGSGNGSTRGKPAPAPLCPPQIPHVQTRD
jgi:hypothetical protein